VEAKEQKRRGLRGLKINKFIKTRCFIYLMSSNQVLTSSSSRGKTATNF